MQPGARQFRRKDSISDATALASASGALAACKADLNRLVRHGRRVIDAAGLEEPHRQGVEGLGELPQIGGLPCGRRLEASKFVGGRLRGIHRSRTQRGAGEFAESEIMSEAIALTSAPGAAAAWRPTLTASCAALAASPRR